MLKPKIVVNTPCASCSNQPFSPGKKDASCISALSTPNDIHPLLHYIKEQKGIHYIILSNIY